MYRECTVNKNLESHSKKRAGIFFMAAKRKTSEGLFCVICDKGFAYRSKYMRHLESDTHKRFSQVSFPDDTSSFSDDTSNFPDDTSIAGIQSNFTVNMDMEVGNRRPDSQNNIMNILFM